jgi:type I restriction enzyme S subunit
MTKKSDAPAIRFKGFSDAWEQRKLGELVDRVVRKNTNNESTLPLTISAQYGLVDQITYFNNRVASRDVSNYYLVLNGEFAYNKSTSDGYPFGAVKRLDLYEKGVLSTLYIVFAPKKEQQIDSDYLTVFFDTDRWHKGVAERAAEGARNHGLLNISAEDFFDIDLSVPKDIVEQKQIGAFIRQLDSLITLHQRKFEKLTNVKKSMLEKMFPQNGSSYPEIRFKGFTDPWEQRKLSEITDKVTEKNAGLQYVETFTNSAEFGIISQRDFFDHDIAKLGSLDGYYIVKNEDFVYNPRISTSAPVGPINRNKLGRTGVMSPLYTVFRPHDIDTTYLEYFFKCGYWHSFMNFNGDSGARSDRFSIRDNVFFQMPIPIPDIDEQKKIGELLTCLDNLITLHQRELEKLQNIKKSMLEKMFV